MERTTPPGPGDKEWEEYLKQTAGKGSKKYRYQTPSHRTLCPNCGYPGPFKVRKQDRNSTGSGTKTKCPNCGKVNRRKRFRKAHETEAPDIDDMPELDDLK